MGSNAKSSNLEAFLEYYYDLKDSGPGYAVLVDGPWGSGKTWQVKEALRRLEPDNNQDKKTTAYLSLYGVGSIGELKHAVLAATNPNIARAHEAFEKAPGYMFGKPATTAVKALGLALSMATRPIVKSDQLLVLDDLERCALALPETLGQINQLVEHGKQRVVVIADTQQFGSDDLASFSRMREKLFGQSFTVEPNVDDAYETFVATAGGDKADTLRRHGSLILELFAASGANSLRILRHVVVNATRLLDVLEPAELNNDTAVRDLLTSLVPYDIAYRNGDVDPDVLTRMRHSVDGFPGKLPDGKYTKDSDKYKQQEQFASRFGQWRPNNPMLSDELVYAMVVQGRFSKQSIRESVDGSVLFSGPTEHPDWQILMNLDTLDDSTLDEAAKRMDTQLASRAIVEPGDLLHVFAFKLMRAENGLIDANVNTVFAECSECITDLEKNDRLPAPLSMDWFETLVTGYGGYVYWHGDSNRAHFEDLQKQLREACERRRKTRYPELVDELKSSMQEGATLLRRRLGTGSPSGDLAHWPIFAGADASLIVNAWLNAPYEHWSDFRQVFAGRFTQHSLTGVLQSEQVFAKKLLDELSRRAQAQKGFSKMRIERAIPTVTFPEAVPLSPPGEKE